MRLREYLANLLVIALSMVLLVHFCLIVLLGNVVIREPNPVILGLEITGLVLLITAAIVNLVKGGGE